jgi:hypothetical protein
MGVGIFVRPKSLGSPLLRVTRVICEPAFAFRLNTRPLRLSNRASD